MHLNSESLKLRQACFLHTFPAIYATGVAGNLSLEAEKLSFFQSELSFFLSDLSFHIAPSFSHKGRVFSGAFTLAVYAYRIQINSVKKKCHSLHVGKIYTAIIFLTVAGNLSF